ncbi:hypothetical protein SMICM17S_06621 [Streptomyces microflavus]
MAGAFHTHHMAPAVEKLRAAVGDLTVTDPTVRYVSNADGHTVATGTEVIARLVGQVANPVRWDLSMETFQELGVTALVELSPGGTLTGLAKRALPGVKTLALKTPDDLDAARAPSPSTQAFKEPESMSKIKPSKGAPYARILGVGGYRPTRVVPNEVILETIDSSDEWIRSRSGIVTRHWASDEETVAMMSIEASGKAIADAGITPEQIGAVIVSTVSHFKQTPAVATEIAHKIGAGKPAAFDISAGCAGFGYGLTLAKGMIVEGSAEHVLVIGVERLSDLTDLEDRATAFLFGDGAGAVVVGPSQEPAIGPTVWGSEGDKSETIKQTVSWNELHIGDVSKLPLDSKGEIKFPAITQEGQAVFRWAVYEMAKVAQQALDAAGISPEDLDVFIPHQANMRIIDSMVKTLKLPEHVTVARDIESTGNTSAASIPLAMERLLATGQAKSGDTALVIGFGAGLVYAATVVTLP